MHRTPSPRTPTGPGAGPGPAPSAASPPGHDARRRGSAATAARYTRSTSAATSDQSNSAALARPASERAARRAGSSSSAPSAAASAAGSPAGTALPRVGRRAPRGRRRGRSPAPALPRPAPRPARCRSSRRRCAGRRTRGREPSTRRLVRVVDAGRGRRPRRASAGPGRSRRSAVRVAPSDDDQPQLRAPQPGQRVEQHRHALARLVEPPDERHRVGARTGRLGASAATSTPLGISTASPPRWRTCTRRADGRDGDARRHLLHQRLDDTRRARRARGTARSRCGTSPPPALRPGATRSRRCWPWWARAGAARRSGARRATAAPARTPPARKRPAPPTRCSGTPTARPTGVTNSGTRPLRGRQHPHDVAAGPQRRRQAEHVRLHAARHVERVRADHPDPEVTAGRPSTAAAGRASRSGRPRRAPQRVAERLRRLLHIGHGGTGAANAIVQPSGENPSRVGNSVAPVSAASRAGPDGSRAGSPNSVTSRLAPSTSRSASTQTTPPPRSRRSSAR